MNVVFDFGGVLFRWAPQEFLPRLLSNRLLDAAAAAALSQAFFQSFDGDWAEFDRGALDVPELSRRIARRTGLTRDEVDTVIAAVPGELEPLPDTVALLHRLKARAHRLFFLSNMPAPYAEFLDRQHAGPAGLLTHFDAGVYSSHVGLIKPELAIYALAERRFGVAAHELLFIDDVARNVAAARGCGWAAEHFVGATVLEAALVSRGLL